MVLRLKTRESRSPPGLQSSDHNHTTPLHTHHTKPPIAKAAGGFVVFGAQASATGVGQGRARKAWEAVGRNRRRGAGGRRGTEARGARRPPFPGIDARSIDGLGRRESGALGSEAQQTPHRARLFSRSRAKSRELWTRSAPTGAVKTSTVQPFPGEDPGSIVGPGAGGRRKDLHSSALPGRRPGIHGRAPRHQLGS